MGEPFSRMVVGSVVVTALSDGAIEASTRIFGRTYGPLVERMLAEQGISELPPISVNAYMVERNGYCTLIDTGAGDKMGPSLGQLGKSMAAAGYRPEDVGTVLLTHMHPDHSNGLSGPDGRPAYPNAELVLHADEVAHWLDDGAMRAATPRQQREDFAAARRELRGYKDRLRVFRGGEVVPGITAVPLPGHTPGHCGYLIDGRLGDPLLIWGDTVHFADAQIADPDITVVLDTDRFKAARTRHGILRRIQEENYIVAGMHLNFPGFSRIYGTSGAYKIKIM